VASVRVIMLEKRKLKVDLAALALSAWLVLLALSLASYDPADPPGDLVYPPHAQAQNICGRVGALLAHSLLAGIGLGTYYLLASLVVVVWLMLAHRPVQDRWLRALGWSLSLLGATTLCTLAIPGASNGPVIGSGGYVGAVGRALLEMNFASAGSYLVAGSSTLVGLLLATDYTLPRIFAGIAVAAAGRMARVSAAAKPSTRTTDLPEGSSTLAIRIGGKTVQSTVAANADEEEEAEEETAAAEQEQGEQDTEQAVESDEAEVAAAAASAQAEPAGSPLRIKARNKKDERREVMQELDAAVSHSEEPAGYELPPIDLLLENEPVSTEEHEKEVRRKAKVLEKTFANFGFQVKVVEIETGPVIAQFEVELEAGLRLSKITSLADDVAIALRVPSVRIVAPIPGKNTVGIEVPNADRQLVRLREVIEESSAKTQKMRIPIYLGKDVAGNPMVADLASLPHLLIAGRTGTGKSVCLNTLIASILMVRRPDEVRLLLIDPKMVELSQYKTLPHLMHPVVTDMRKAEAILAWAVEKMEERYALLARAGVRHIAGYNQLGEEELMDRLQPESDEERKNIPTHLPYIVIVADEMADLMMTAAKEVETHIIRLAQKSRAVGIHLVLATQKPTVDVITGLIKSNLPARIAFQVASRTDSRVVLDEMGADKLLGNGDMLFLWPGTSTLIRGQGTYVSDEEINKVVEFVGTSEPEFVKELVALKPGGATGDADHFKNRDELYEAAIDVIIREGRGSVSLLQRALGVGYGRGARLIDFMAEDGIVGAYNGSQAREVLITLEQWEQMRTQGGQESAAPGASTAKRTNKIRPEPEMDDAESEEVAAHESDDDSSAEWDQESDEVEAEEDEESDDEGDDAAEEEQGDEGEEEDFDESEDDDDVEHDTSYAETA
jgi:S-DNA-T family DNA segregation ATPase FtsK/SpoIIIE